MVIYCVLNTIFSHSDQIPIFCHVLFHPGSKQNMQGNINSSFPSTWLTQSLIPFTELGHGISKNSKNTQNVHTLLDHNYLTGGPVGLQDHHSCEYLRQYPNSWAPGKRVECPTDCPSWSHLPLINGDKVRREEKRRQKKQEASANSQGDNHDMQKLRNKVNSSDTEPGKARLHSCQHVVMN